MASRGNRPPPLAAPQIAPPPRMTQTEISVWAAYGLVAVLLILVPLLTHSLGLVDFFAWGLLLGAAGLSLYWMRSGSLQGPEWLTPDDYEEFLAELQGTAGPPVAPRQRGRRESREPSASPPPAR